MHSPSLSARALEIARRAAEEAGRFLLERLESFGSISRKSSPRDLVTEVDLGSERILVRRLREAFPEHAIEAEEEVRDALDPTRPRWFLDPLDGTVNYVHGLPFFAISMGLYVGGRAEVALVHAPRLGETFCARRGAGAFLGERRLQASQASALGEAVLATGFPYRRNELANPNLENFARLFFDVRDLRRMGSAALDLAYVAAGRLDGYWEFHLAPHDVAAGALLVEEAGGRVSDARGGTDWLRAGSIVAAGVALHEALRERLKV